MLKLYVKSWCPYCAMVLKKLEEADIPFEELNIEKEEVLNELIQKGGKRIVPFLVDEERGVEMYESADIVNYLEENYCNVHKS